MRKEIPAQTIIVCDLCGQQVDEIYGYIGKTKDFCYPCKYKILQKVEDSICPIEKCYVCKGTKINQHEYFYEGVKEPCQCQRKLEDIFI